MDERSSLLAKVIPLASPSAAQALTLRGAVLAALTSAKQLVLLCSPAPQ